MDKVYVVTTGEYSDYRINNCFTTKEKAQEYIEKAKKIKNIYNPVMIEEYKLDESTEVVKVITISFTFASPFSKSAFKQEESIESNVEKAIRSNVVEYTSLCGIWNDTLEITRIANPNKKIKDEIERCKKIAYDTAKKIKYLYEVENVKTIEEMRARLNGVE